MFSKSEDGGWAHVCTDDRFADLLEKKGLRGCEVVDRKINIKNRILPCYPSAGELYGSFYARQMENLAFNLVEFEIGKG